MGHTQPKLFWAAYEPLINAVVELFHPFVEVAVHDLQKGEIVAIFNNISKRHVGDSSPLKELKIHTKNFPPYFSPYYKKNWDGRALKCTSIALNNLKGEAVGLICINVDISQFQEGHRLLQLFVGIKEEGKNPIELYGVECESAASSIIQEYIEAENVSLQRLGRIHKKRLVQRLYHKGIFNYKNAVPYLTMKLNCSRGSIYNYIKEIY